MFFTTTEERTLYIEIITLQICSIPEILLDDSWRITLIVDGFYGLLFWLRAFHAPAHALLLTFAWASAYHQTSKRHESYWHSTADWVAIEGLGFDVTKPMFT
jgi:hypothetical protein